MFNSASAWIFLAVAVASNFALDGLLDCSPNSVKEAVTCASLGSSVPVGGGLYSNWEFHFNPIMSAYYGARMLEALGLHCPANKTLQSELDLTTSWSGAHGITAIEWAHGGNRAVWRNCRFPTASSPFICTGTHGTPGTDGPKLGTVAYIALLHDNVNHRWTLFGQCWNAKTPEHPDTVEEGTSWHVYSLDQTLSETDRASIIATLSAKGFRTSPTDLICQDYTKP